MRLALGWVLIVASVPVGLLPGPGGIFVFAAGAALLLRHSTGAKRLYVRLGRRWPRLRHTLDRALRRPRRQPQPANRIDSPVTLP